MRSEIENCTPDFHAAVIRVEFDSSTEEFEYLTAAVQVLKGQCHYLSEENS